MNTRRKLWFGVALLGIALLLWRYVDVATHRLLDPVTVDAAFVSQPETAFAGSAVLVCDDRAGFRLGRNVAGTDWRSDAQGLLRSGPALSTISGPRVLLIGDEQCFAGVAESERLAVLVEQSLRATGGRLSEATVIDASCPRSSLLQHTLRAPELVARYRPHCVLVVIATGDDLIAFEDRSVPHLDAALELAPADAPANLDPLGLSTRATELSPGFSGLTTHGLGQLLYASTNPDLLARLPDRLDRCIAHLHASSPRGGLLLVFVPPAHLISPAAIAPHLTPLARTLLSTDLALRLHQAPTASAQRIHVTHLDLLDLLTNRPGRFVNTSLGCLGVEGHRLAADALAKRLVSLFEVL